MGGPLIDAALATITGTGVSVQGPFTMVLPLILAVYSVAVLVTQAGSLAGSLAGSPGASFRRGQHPAPAPDLEENFAHGQQ